MVVETIARRTARRLFVLAAVGVLCVVGPQARSTQFSFVGTDIVIDQPAPLFTSATITGDLVLEDSILPGQSFGSAAITGLTLDFGGIVGTLADIQADIAPDVVQGFGTRSLDGKSFSVFDLRFGFPSGVPGCSFVCAGQIVINSPIGPNDPSNFIAINDLDGNSTSVISSYTPRFDLVSGTVPEPGLWMMIISGFATIGIAMRRREAAPRPSPLG